MNKKWIFVTVCMIVLLVLCEAGDKGKAKKKSKKQKEKEMKKTSVATTAETTTQKGLKEDKMKTGNRKAKGKREISKANADELEMESPYTGKKKERVPVLSGTGGKFVQMNAMAEAVPVIGALIPELVIAA